MIFASENIRISLKGEKPEELKDVEFFKVFFLGQRVFELRRTKISFSFKNHFMKNFEEKC